MAKDPATLWYWNDWHSGTILMSRFLKGCYMDLLHAQFNHGRLSLEEIKTILGSDFGQAWPTIQKKLTVDETGRYFNERLENEKIKRKKHSEHQRNNVLKRWGKYDGNTTVYTKPIPLENENENENIIVFNKEKEKFKNDFRWKEKFCRDKSISMPDLERKMDEFISDIELKEDFKDLKELKSHFTNTFNKNKKIGNTKTGTSTARVDALKNW